MSIVCARATLESVNSQRVAQAIENNVRWCDLMCRLHTTAGERHAAYWIQRGSVPPYMSKLITTSDVAAAAEQRAAIRVLIEADPSATFSVKDAHACLDLADLGFEVLFRATWIWREPGSPMPVGADERLEWSLVNDLDMLEIWERTWRGTKANADAREQPCVFPPTLLEEAEVRLLLGHSNGVPAATAALNRSGAVVGLSNVFSDAAHIGPLFPGCVRKASELYPDLAIVGYERGAGLGAATAAGFEPMSELVVWNRTPGIAS